MKRSYDVVVIGGNTAAMIAAVHTRTGGKSVAVVDFRHIRRSSRVYQVDEELSGLEHGAGALFRSGHGVKSLQLLGNRAHIERGVWVES